MAERFSLFQSEIYLRGLGGETPIDPVDWNELESAAEKKLEDSAVGYLFGGAGTESTMRANLEALSARKIVPRMLRDVSERDVSTTVLGQSMPAPLLLAPIGVQSIIHPQGELASARAAAALGLTFIASTASSFSIEEQAEAGDQSAGGTAPRWYQLYWPSDRELAQSFVKRAESAGYTAIVVTLDTHHLAWRPRDLQSAYLPFLQGIGIANYTSDPVFRSRLEQPPEEDIMPAVGQFVGVFTNPALNWDDLAWLREQTKLPIVLKGIQHAADARRARDHGIDGVIVSNHGGRQVDGAIGSLDALPGVVAEAGDEMEVLFDSGIRSGSDMIKALSLGARAVLLGRPYMWGLALGGEEGVRRVLRGLLAELDLTLGLCGYNSVRELSPDVLA